MLEKTKNLQFCFVFREENVWGEIFLSIITNLKVVGERNNILMKIDEQSLL